MAIGTAGYTAALAVCLLEQNDMSPAQGKVVVNGATGGVATLAIDMLSARGYDVTAVTGKDGEHEFLKSIGAREVLPRSAIDYGTRPLEKALWAAAFDSVGGEQLTWLTLASDLKPRHLADIAFSIPLEGLPAQFDKLLQGTGRGRAVVRIS
jgi:acrylyl-CoA reductase (NADPH)